MTPRVWKACAERLIANGYSPVPLRPGTKLPLLKRWNALRDNPLSEALVAKIAAQHSGLGLAVAGGYNGLVPIDIDSNDPAIHEAIFDALPEPMVAKAGRRGMCVFYRFEPSDPVTARKFVTAPPNGQMLCEVLTTGLSTIPPTRHPETGLPYRDLLDATLYHAHVGELSVIRSAHIERVAGNLSRWLLPPVRYVPTQPPTETRTSDRRLAAYARAVLQGQVRLLSAMGKETGRNPALFLAMCALGKYVHHQVLTDAEVRNELMKACVTNGSVRDHGIKQCHDTINQGLKKSKNDALPNLPDRQRAAYV